jgi:nucleoside-diphosphate-sugar epimerase
MSKVLVTGSNGFIGRHLVRALRLCQHEVVELDSSAGDVSESATWIHLERADVLIHLANKTFVPDSWSDPSAFLKTNLLGTGCALNYCRQHNTRLIYLSSYLYGNPTGLPISESAVLVASNPYALSKILAEQACKFYADVFGVKVIVFRPFNVYGLGQSEDFLIPSLVSQMLAGLNIRVKDLEPRRDYVYIDDLVDAIAAAVNRPIDFDTFNIGVGVSYSVADLIQTMQDIGGTRLEIISAGVRRSGEVMDTVADIRKASRILNWSPKFSLRSGLEIMLNLSRAAGQKQKQPS